jgi:hypothetical protein
MRTTIDIPDELYREAKARAALDGVKLKDLFTEALREKLRAPAPKARRHRTKFPIIKSTRTDKKITDEMVKEALEQEYIEEAQRHAQFMRH